MFESCRDRQRRAPKVLSKINRFENQRDALDDVRFRKPSLDFL
jgi:hypothetical protein